MIGLGFFFLCGYLVMNYGKPVHFGALYAVLMQIVALINGNSIGSLFFGGAILFAYSAFVYMVVDRYSDGILAPIGILIGGALILVGAALYI